MTNIIKLDRNVYNYKISAFQSTEVTVYIPKRLQLYFAKLHKTLLIETYKLL